MRYLWLVIGVLAVYFIVRAAGFGEALDAAWRAVRTAYGAMIEGSLGSLSRITAALQSGDRHRIYLKEYEPTTLFSTSARDRVIVEQGTKSTEYHRANTP